MYETLFPSSLLRANDFSTKIKDVKDCPPIFEDSLYGGTTFGDKKGDEVLRVIVRPNLAYFEENL